MDLFSDAPSRDPRASAYLLAAYIDEFPAGNVFLSVVDPGVGSERASLAVWVDRRWYVGPDNGLFELILRRALTPPRIWEIAWRPDRLSPTFHGRDLFAPVAARLARGETAPVTERTSGEGRKPDWPDDLPQIVYIDGFGNAMTGIRAPRLGYDTELEVDGLSLKWAENYSRVPPNSPFWYENANGLAEIAVNMENASEIMGLRVGSEVAIGGVE